MERERNRKYYQDFYAKLRLLKQKEEEQESREKKQLQMNQLQYDIDILKIEQKYTRKIFDIYNNSNKALINNNVVEKEEEKEPIIPEPVSVNKDLRENEDTRINEDKPEIVKKPEDSTVVLPVGPKSQELKEDDEDEAGLPDWVPYVALSSIRIVSSKIKKYF